MTTFPWLTALLVVPLVGALVVMLLPKANEKGAKLLGLVVSLIVLAMTIVMALQFHPAEAADFQFAVSYDWIPAFGVHFALGVDGIALVPMCPHTLTARPITLPDRCRIEIVLLPPHDSRVHFDGQTRYENADVGEQHDRQPAERAVGEAARRGEHDRQRPRQRQPPHPYP